MMEGKFSVHNQLKTVSTFDELINTKFQGAVNAIGWQRNLEGDFKEIVAKLELKENVSAVAVDELLDLSLTKEGELARDIILQDLKLLEALGALPALNLIKCYERDEEFAFISTDVYSYHIDRSPVAVDTFLCTYHGAASEIIPNDQAEQQILIPEIRQKLQSLYDGPAAGFEDFLKAHFFDLHYQLKSGAKPINLGVGNLWKLAVDHPEQQVLPCIHRAPLENEGEYRLLLIC